MGVPGRCRKTSQWTADSATILQALGVLDPAGKPTALLDTVKAADVARLTKRIAAQT